MFTAVITEMTTEEVDGLCRPELVDRITSLRELKSAVAAYEARVVQAIDALDDSGLDGRGVLRSHGRVSSQSAARVANTANGLADLPKASASLASGRITIEHANALVRAGRRC